MHYYQLNIGDFLKATDGFSDAEVGVFVRLLNRYASTEKPIKTQWVNLAFKGESQQKAICILECAFEETEDGWIYPDLGEQVEKYAKNAEKNRENGRKGGRPRKDKSESVNSETQQKPTGLFVESEINPNESLTINHKPITNIPSVTNVTSGSSQGKAPVEKARIGTHKFDLESLPTEWRQYCEELRPDLNPETVFVEFKAYWTIGRGAGKLRSDKGWNQSWFTWCRQQREGNQQQALFKPVSGPKEPAKSFSEMDYGESGAF